MLEIPILDFEKVVKEELEENPALENADESIENTVKDDYQKLSPIKSKLIPPKNQRGADISKVSLTDFLESQLMQFNLSKKYSKIALFLIGNIDDNGYITRELEYIAEDIFFNRNISVSIKELEYILHNVIFKLQPLGVGARNLRECLLLQLMGEERVEKNKISIEIVKNYFVLFAKKKYDIISKKLKISIDDIRKVEEDIKKLTPKPGLSFDVNTKTNTETIIPDFIVHVNGDKINLELYEKPIPELTLSKKYEKMLSDINNKNTRDNKEIKDFLTKKLEDAKNFIQSIKKKTRNSYKYDEFNNK